MSELNLNSSNFQDEVINSEIPVMVDFFAEWCGPCKMLGPVVEQLASEYEGKVKIFKLNVDSAQNIAAEYGISGVPTVLFFKDGDMVDKFTGALPKAQIEEYINKYV